VIFLCRVDGSLRLNVRAAARRLWCSTQRGCFEAIIGCIFTYHGCGTVPEFKFMLDKSAYQVITIHHFRKRGHHGHQKDRKERKSCKSMGTRWQAVPPGCS